MSANPEKEFLNDSLKPYEGMNVEEVVFTRMENFRGEMLDYKLDVITAPEKSDVPKPAFIFIHGGGFIQPHDKRQGYIPVFANVLTKASCTVFSPDYPVYDDDEHRKSVGSYTLGAQKAAEAIHRAYLFIKENAERFNIDPDRIAIGGGSAGGMISFYLLEHYDDEFKMFINCWGSPIPYVPDIKGFPPTLSIHGTADQAVSFSLEAPIQEAFEKEGIDHLLISIENAPHTPIRFKDQYMPTIVEWIEKYLK